MNYIAEMTGKRFGRLIAVEYRYTRYGKKFFLFRCDCGTEKEINSANVKRGLTQSCGCLHSEVISTKGRPEMTKHGLNLHPLYNTWVGMMNRCYNTTRHNYKYYGARGITVCERWRNSVALFIEDVGEKPSPRHTIDRIDNSGNYEPGNVRWATQHEQNLNTRKRGTC